MGAAQERAGNVVVVEDGVARFGLVLPDDPTEDEALAAEELSRYVERMTGVPLERIGRDAARRKIYLGCVTSFSGTAVDLTAHDHFGLLKHEEFCIDVIEDDLYLIGGSPRGVLWAVYGILHEMGCRWYMPGEIGEVIPKRDTLSLDARRRVDGPDFSYRWITYTWGGPKDGAEDFEAWMRRNRCAQPPVPHGHNLKASLPPEASFEKRPELYALNGDRRTQQQVCTSHPDVLRMITQTVNEYFDTNPDSSCYSLCPDDNTDFCECEHCRSLDAGGYDEELKRPVVTDRYVTFVSHVAEKIQERHPGKMVSMYAYNNHTSPPVHASLSPYVVVFFTTNRYCGGHGIGDEICASRMQMKVDLTAWTRACPNVYIYEYDPVPYNAECPWPVFGARVREMPLYRQMGVKGLSVEGHCSWATLSPNHWVTAQTLWDAGRSEEELLRDYCNGFYGLDVALREGSGALADIAELMYSIHMALQAALAKYEPKLKWEMPAYDLIFSRNLLRACRRQLIDAFAASGRASQPDAKVVRERLRMADLGFRYLRRVANCQRILRTDGDPREFETSYADCVSLIEEMQSTNSSYVEVRSAVPGLIRDIGGLLETRSGAAFGLVSEWNAIGPFDNAGHEGHVRAYPPEREIDLQAAYEGKTGSVKWRVIKAKGNRGYIDLLQHSEPTDWVTIYVMNYLHTERDIDVQLRMGSNDSLKAWVGGEPVWDVGSGREAAFDGDIVPVHLPAGSTPVLLKISQMERNWGFYFRVTDSVGMPAQGVRVGLKP